MLVLLAPDRQCVRRKLSEDQLWARDDRHLERELHPVDPAAGRSSTRAAVIEVVAMSVKHPFRSASGGRRLVGRREASSLWMNESHDSTSANPARSRIITRSRLTTKNRITIPLEVRKALNLKPGDTMIFEESAFGTVRIRNAQPLDLEFVSGLENTLPEWNTDADDRAYQDL